MYDEENANDSDYGSSRKSRKSKSNNSKSTAPVSVPTPPSNSAEIEKFKSN